MDGRVAFPFLVLPDQTVEATQWMIGPVGEPLQPSSDTLDYWDYPQDLEVRRQIRVDRPSAADALDLDPDDMHLMVLLSVGTGRGNMPRQLWTVDTRQIRPEDGVIALSATIESCLLSGRLWLEMEILLAREPDCPGQFSPRYPAARLWGSHQDILLEDGGSARFPMEIISFAAAFPDRPQQGSPWFFSWRPGQWHKDFAGAVRLYVNRDMTHIAYLVENGDPLTLRLILADLMGQVLRAAVNDEELEPPVEYEEGTLGQLAFHWLDLSFPNHEVDSVRAMLDHRPGEFHAAILEAAEVEYES